MKIFIPIILGILVATAFYVAVPAPEVFAATISDGLDNLKSKLDLPTNNNIRGSVENSVNYILSFVALAAVITVIVAGIFLIVGAGSDPSIQRAKKIIIYTIVGLFVIFFARVIVTFFTTEIANNLP